MVADPKDRNIFLLVTLGETAADRNGRFFLHETDSFHFPTDICHSNCEDIAVLLLVEMNLQTTLYFCEVNPRPGSDF